MNHDHLNTMISVADAAAEIGVSVATIHNWMRQRRIEGDGGLVSRSSLDLFLTNSIGVDRLNARANKLYKRAESEVVEYAIDSWADYESTLTEAHRNREGVYYTPQCVVRDMLAKIDGCDLRGKRFLDPCCGSGNFLIEALKLGFAAENIYGYDVDPHAVEIARHRIEELSGCCSDNVVCCDFLEVADGLGVEFDYIFTNPPWGKKIDRSSREALSSRYDTGRSRDSSSLFLSASLALLKERGQLGFLLPAALFNIGSYEDIRRILYRFKIDYLIDYGRAFPPLLTKAQAIILTKSRQNEGIVQCYSAGQGYTRTQRSFEVNPQLIFNLCTTSAESEIIESLFKRDHITLRGRAKWGMGIVTGDNRRFCKEMPRAGFRPIYRGADIESACFKTPKLYVSDDLSVYQQSAPMELYNAPVKLVYRFISSRLCFACDREQRLILNSANFLIVDDDFPIQPDELVKLLNSNFMNWLFQKIFSTHKILRGNLEALPIFPDALQNGVFDEDHYLESLNVKRDLI